MNIKKDIKKIIERTYVFVIDGTIKKLFYENIYS